MTVLRSLGFNLVFFSYHLLLVFILTLLLVFPRRWSQAATKAWTRGAVVVLKTMIGLDFEVKGAPPEGPCIIVSKHQSAWDTFVFYLLLDDPNYVLKKELTRLPIWGWCALKCGAISVDRSGGGAALKQLVRDVETRMIDGRQVIIFPEGTRTAPGERRDYQPGVAAVYARTQSPVVPVALNSGLFWGRRSFRKKSGTITVQFLEPMPQGLKRREFMAELETRMETATDALIDGANTRFPHLNDDGGA
ncbi:MAG: 1-acyl-sn-glycerol-3-phosphate acyltransferase [Alphaproteobacteria bacterium]|jgi:1-acyl-sn-glycerol-3-phosphate acyltransferase|nr:1-acyl-sn-glycerol-3-phosphate acyltransferase [Alphaproteobacteria bacterium]